MVFLEKKFVKSQENCYIMMQWWVVNFCTSYVTIMCRNDELSWLFNNRFRATTYMKVKRMGITEILRRICLLSANNIKSSESGSKQPTQLIVELISSLRHIIVTLASLLQQSSKLQVGDRINKYFRRLIKMMKKFHG